MNKLSIQPAGDIDPARLADIRVEAMRPSLQAVGRYNPARARDRFLASYSPNDTKLIHHSGKLAGFYVVRHYHHHIYLDHLYIDPNFQGERLGRKVVTLVQSGAKEAGLPLKLVALKGSDANRFYLSCGFVHVSSDEFDNHYIWDV